MIPEPLEIRAVRVTADAALVEQFCHEHTAVLHDIGVADTVPVTGPWLDDPHTILLCAVQQRLGLVAGARIVRAHDHVPLPMQLALPAHRRTLDAVLGPLVPAGIGELSGFWTARRFTGRGIARLLVDAASACAPRSGLRWLCCLASEHMRVPCVTSGFETLRIADGDAIPYPDVASRSYAMLLRDLAELRAAAPVNRRHALELRAQPEQTRRECPSRVPLLVRYDLRV